jgi:hypothetical protein
MANMVWMVRAFLLLSGVVTPLLWSAPVKLIIWPVDALIKVLPHDPQNTNRASGQTWLVARNGQTSVQFAIRSEEPVLGLRVRVTLEGGLQHRVRRAGLVPVSSNPPGTPREELIALAPAFIPDPLLEDFPYRLPAHRTDAIWITIHAPAGVAPGVYQGKAVFESEAGELGSQTFRVQVSPRSVPAQRTLRVTNWFNTSPAHLARYYSISGEDDTYWEILANIGQVMSEYRQNVILTPVRALVTPRVQDGQLTYDFSRLDRWINTFDRAGMELFEGGHLLSRVSGYHTPLRVPAWVIEDGGVVERKLEPEDPRAAASLHAFTRALYAHLERRGITKRWLQHVHDEPHGEERAHYNRFARLIRGNLPGIPILDAVDLKQDLGFFAGVADIWVPILGSFDQQMEKIRKHKEGGGQAWFYTCLYPQGQHLNRLIDLPLIKTRLLHWLNFRHGFSGYLHWGGNYWSADPWNNVQPVINDGTTLLPAGDNALVYPWPEKKSIRSSIRLEAMRESIEDYELLLDLAKSNPQQAEQLAREAVPQFTDYIREVTAFRKLQARLLEE